MNNPIDRVLDAVSAKTGRTPRKTTNGWESLCPAHDDRNPSLSIAVGNDGRVLLNCHTKCSHDDICAALGLAPSDLFERADAPAASCTKQFDNDHRRCNDPKPRGMSYATAQATIAALDSMMGKREQGQRAAIHWYRDAASEPVAAVVRYDLPKPPDEKQRKTFRPVSKHDDGWRCGDPEGLWPLYCLPELSQADLIVVTEGEKAADAARSIGFVATSSAHGAQSPNKTDWTPLAGKSVIILPDNDDAGRKYAETVAQILHKLGCSVRIVDLPDLLKGGDIVDWIEAHGDAAEPDELRGQVESLANGVNTFQAPSERDRARIEFPKPVPASELGEGAPVDWIWFGWLARECITLLVGLWKGGKTTLLAHLYRGMENGGSIAGTIKRARVLVIAEESAGMWRRRRDELGLQDHVHFHIRPFKGRPTATEWSRYIDVVASWVREDGYDAVVIDTWQSVSPCPDENDASAMMAALIPIRLIAEAGAAVCIVHHPRKGDAGEGQASRGSGALPGFVDVIAELRRFSTAHESDTRRKLRGYSRLDETPTEIVIELTDKGYVTLGNSSDATREARCDIIHGILVSEALTVDEILARWPTDVLKPSQRTVSDDMKVGAETGKWLRSGKGRRADAFRYSKSDSGNSGS